LRDKDSTQTMLMQLMQKISQYLNFPMKMQSIHMKIQNPALNKRVTKERHLRRKNKSHVEVHPQTRSKLN
jgi:hypothetical protein